jgi:hypothetical protein
MKKRTMSSGRPFDRTVQALLAVAVVATLTGCYWTDGSGTDAGLTLEIVRERGDGFSSQEIVDPYGFLFAYVIEESVLLGGTDAIIDLFSRLEQEFNLLDEELEGLDFEDEAAFQDFIDNYRFNIEFPAAQFQGQFITFQRGASGRNTFRGLNAGANYLVVVEAYGEDYEAGVYADAIGFGLTTVRAGENRSVSLELGDNYTEFDDFLLERYRFAAPVLDEELVLDLQYGTFFDNWNEQQMSVFLSTADLSTAVGNALNETTTSTVQSGLVKFVIDDSFGSWAEYVNASEQYVLPGPTVSAIELYPDGTVTVAPAGPDFVSVTSNVDPYILTGDVTAATLDFTLVSGTLGDGGWTILWDISTADKENFDSYSGNMVYFQSPN